MLRLPSDNVSCRTKYAKEAATLTGEQIKLRRKLKKWSENDLAQHAGISRATLKRLRKMT